MRGVLRVSTTSAPARLRTRAAGAVVLLAALAACAQPAAQAAPVSATTDPTTPAAASTTPAPSPTSPSAAPTPSPTRPAAPRATPAVVVTPRPTPAPVASVQRPRPTGIDVQTVSAGGVRQSISCRGTGPVTVVVVTGLGTAASQWSQVRAGFQQVTRTCFYDRPGLGASPPRPVAGQVVDAGLYARELKSLLYAAGEPGPYIVVGHSFGGLIARAFVVQNMSSVLGVMLAESVDPGDTTTGAFWHEAGHAVDMARSQAADGGGPWLGGRPLLVLSASHPEEDHLGGPTYGQPQWLTDQWIAEQRADVRLSSDAIQVIATSGHVLQQDDPPAVVEAVRELVRSVVTGARLACSPVWASVASTCR